jgi:hypothetical protein
MTWGLNRTSVLALTAAAGLAMSGWSLEAKAADLGGNCCADLEERIADLEATTARKGNRKVSLEISGSVNKAIMAWNDGKDSDAYVVDNYQQSSRLRFKGSASLVPGWKAGYYIEYELREAGSQNTSQFDSGAYGLDGGKDATGSGYLNTALRLRQNNAFIESEKFGRVTLGLLSPAAKDIMNTNLGGSIGQDPENNYLTSFYLRDNKATSNATVAASVSTQIPNSSKLQTKYLWNDMDSTRIDAIRYDTPAIYGFILSAAWGQNDFWDVALRYQKEWNSFRVAGGVGYTWASGRISDNDIQNGAKETENVVSATTAGAGQYWASCNGANYNTCLTTKSQTIVGSASILHTPTGLYTSWAAGTRHLDNVPTATINSALNKDAVYWFGQFGITKRFFEPGATTFFVDYGQYHNFAVGDNYGATTDALTGTNYVTGSDVDRWGVGAVQAFDSAAVELYTKYEHYSYSVNTSNTVTPTSLGAVKSRSPEDQDVVVSGMRMKF